MKSRILIFFFSLGLALLVQIPAFAVDELTLCGIVYDIDQNNSMVSVDVKSENCRGLKQFKVRDFKMLASFQVDKSRCFVIDHARCEPSVTSSIIRITRGE
jgi:ribosomal protein S1